MRRLVAYRHWLGWGFVAGLPVALLVILLARLLPDNQWVAPVFHFYVVSFTALLTAVLAGLVAYAAHQVKDIRVLFLALAFLGIAGLFLAHALTTPGVLVPGLNPWVGFSAYASLLAGAAGLALSAIDWPPAVQRALVARQGALLGGFVALLAIYGLVAVGTSLGGPTPPAAAGAPGPAAIAMVYDPAMGMLMPVVSGTVAHHTAVTDYGAADAVAAPAAPPADYVDDDDDGPLAALSSPLLARGLAGLTFALLALALARLVPRYRTTRAPLLAGLLVAVIFLAQAQLSLVLAPVWHASWWEYHGLMLAAFFAALAGLGREYAASGSLQGVVEGLLLRDTLAQLERGYADVIRALVAAVEAKDPYTRGHTERVTALAVHIGEGLGLSPERLRVLGQAALLHDIGKIGVPDAILQKPGPLTDEEFAVIREHPARGHAIIAGVRGLTAEVGGVRHHHERLDGSGYPDGLAGAAIPLEARIIAVADVYDALTSQRAYREAWPPARALALIDGEAGAKLDPRCVAALHRVLGAQPAPGRADGPSRPAPYLAESHAAK
ncbi:MAG TPA: HD domain-containing phosphohydrolase [Thermomicrobiales bacterium]|nr:HD domain-containing phosphohydrolase [Thermomicrobiales bacterium]